MGVVKVGLLLLAMEVMDVGCNTMAKAAMTKGMSNFIFTTYTHGLGFIFLMPIAFIFHRKTPVPPIGLSMILRISLLGFLCCCCSIFLFLGIRCSSPTLASAMNNLSPALTFIMGIIFRMENLNLRAHSSLLKLIGTVVSITGAFIVTFYQGLPIILWLSSPTEFSRHSVLESTEPNWALGGFFLATSSIFLSLMYIIKTWIARDFHSEVLITVISFISETGVAALITLAAEKDTSVWFPSLNIMWITILYGALVAAAVNTVQTWACGKKGPLFVAMFKPLQMIIAVVMGVSFLKDVLHIGSVIGGSILALGFYTVMKGKADEEVTKQVDEDTGSKVPLLQDKNTLEV